MQERVESTVLRKRRPQPREGSDPTTGTHLRNSGLRLLGLTLIPDLRKSYDSLAACCRRIQEAADRGKPPEREVVQQLLEIECDLELHAKNLERVLQSPPGDVARFDLNELVRATATRLRDSGLTGNAHVALSLNTTPIWVRASRSQLEQVLIELVKNAAEATATIPGRQPSIIVSLEVTAEETMVSVRDNGCGISPAQRDQLFEAYFGTKDVAHHPGLGLTFAQQVLSNHRGRVSLESEVDAGTTVCFALPRLRG